MSKELEALKSLKRIKNIQVCVDYEKDIIKSVNEILPNSCYNVEQALTELQQIKNTKPSEALECLEKIVDKARINDRDCCHWRECLNTNKCVFNSDNLMCPDYVRANTIKQALIQKSKKELAWEIAVKKNVDILNLRECIERELMNDIPSALEYYNEHYTLNDGMKLTEEEFELLKECLK